MERTLIPKQFHVVSTSALPPTKPAELGRATFDTQSSLWQVRQWPPSDPAEVSGGRAAARQHARHLLAWYNAMHAALTSRHTETTQPLAAPAQALAARWASSVGPVQWGCSAHAECGPQQRFRAGEAVAARQGRARHDLSVDGLLHGGAEAFSRSPGGGGAGKPDNEPSHSDQATQARPSGLLAGSSRADAALSPLTRHQVRMLRLGHRKRELLAAQAQTGEGRPGMAYRTLWEAGAPPPAEEGDSASDTESAHSGERTVSFSRSASPAAARPLPAAPAAQQASLDSALHASMAASEDAISESLTARAEDIQRLAFIALHEVSRQLTSGSPTAQLQAGLLHEVLDLAATAQTALLAAAKAESSLVQEALLRGWRQLEAVRYVWRAGVGRQARHAIPRTPCTGGLCARSSR